jgi:hypothetical protein
MSFDESDWQLGRLNSVNSHVTENSHENNKHHTVPCFPLATILLALNRSHVDYWSLDVEGLELDVLKTVPFDSLDISVLSVEYNHVTEGKDAVRSYMEGQGYSLYKDITLSRDDITLWVNDYIFVKKGFHL